MPTNTTRKSMHLIPPVHRSNTRRLSAFLPVPNALSSYPGYAQFTSAGAAVVNECFATHTLASEMMTMPKATMK